MLIYAEHSCLKEPLSIFHIAGWSITNTNEELCHGLLKKSNSLGILTWNTLFQFKTRFPVLHLQLPIFDPSLAKLIYFFLYQAYHYAFRHLSHSTHPDSPDTSKYQSRKGKANRQHIVVTCASKMPQGNGQWKEQCLICSTQLYTKLLVVSHSVTKVMWCTSSTLENSRKHTCWISPKENIIK